MGNKTRPGRLRIVAGNWRSRVLPVADVPGLRPTSERIRETLFNWLGPGIYGQRCLDLYAGSGALGLEALSRGAASVDFVETSSLAARALQSAIDTLGAKGATLYQEDATQFLNRSAEPYDLIFLDPPFEHQSQELLCRLIHDTRQLTNGGRVYVEQPKDQRAISLPAGWELLKSKAAGNVRYSLLRGVSSEA
jgi:16S rRNA (guanine966-N2)-methyltransferase